MRLEHIKELRLFPDGVCSKDIIFLVVIPVDVANREIVALGHLKWTSSLLYLVGLCWALFLDVVVEVVHNLVVHTHYLERLY